MFLLFTHQQDYYTIDLVKSSLESSGFEALRLNTDDFPLHIELTQEFCGTSSGYIYYNDKRIATNDVQGVWLRKFFSPKVDSSIDEVYRKGCFYESLETLKGFFYTLNHVTWIDPLDVVSYASNKLVQLQVAQRVGLRIPRTMVTNNQQDLRNFYNANNGDIVVKMQTTLSTSMQGGGLFLHTSRVTANDLEDAALVSLCPLMFQELIEKEYELRVIYVDGAFFAGKMDASSSKSGQVDCRLAGVDEFCWQAYELPQPVMLQLDSYMKSMGLLFGAIDLIKSAKGEYVFLEVNPTGEWGMLQRDLNLPIAQAIASTLIKKARK